MVASVNSEPCEGRRVLEGFLGGCFIWCTYVNGTAGMMFAVARCSVDGKNVVNAQAALALSFENPELVIMAAITGNRLQGHMVAQRSIVHLQPCGRGVWMQPQRTSIAIEACQRQLHGLRHQRKACTQGVTLIQSQCNQVMLQSR